MSKPPKAANSFAVRPKKMAALEPPYWAAVAVLTTAVFTASCVMLMASPTLNYSEGG